MIDIFMNIFCIIVFTIFISLVIWIIIGGLILTPFAGIINKLEPMDCSYSPNADTLRQMVLWPYMLFKVYKYKKQESKE